MKRTLLVGVLAWTYRGPLAPTKRTNAQASTSRTSLKTGETVQYLFPGSKRGSAIVRVGDEHYLIPESFLSIPKEN